MRLNLRLLTIVLICLLFSLQNAQGWNSIGHMTVAYAAYQQLTPAQKARAATLLALNPNSKKWLGYVAQVAPGASAADQQMYVFILFARDTPAFRPGRDSGSCEARPVLASFLWYASSVEAYSENPAECRC